jgi:signal peptidase I
VFRVSAEKADLIKRVIGLPGDTVAVRGGRLILNGHAVAREPLPPVAIPVSANTPCKVVPRATPTVIALGKRQDCMFKAYQESLPGGPSYTVLDQVEHGQADDFGPVRVPPGHVFMMGDNRDDSLDSRFPEYEGGIGMVPVENLIGRALVTFWSTDGSASYAKPWTWFTALRVSRIGNGYTGEAE